ncbi:MAG TPA: hypothetical protein DD473_02530 [Planctomycetaceae bacterium]|nr:hypothetical protein [Planctomycetaceae bacterium]
MRPQGYILSGGKSLRFGSDKARHKTNSQSLIENLDQKLSHWTGQKSIAVADRSDKYLDLNIPTIADIHPEAGPLAGLHAALTHSQKTTQDFWIVLISCDMTELKPDWLDILWERAQQSEGALSIHFMEGNSKISETRLHPFPGCYHISLIPILETRLATQQRSFFKLFQQLSQKCHSLPIPENWPKIPQINTPQESLDWQNSLDHDEPSQS